MNKLQKPFLKWAGGKTQIIDAIIEKFPTEINNYYEPFLGGGSVLLAILSLKNKIVIKKNIYAFDININLINVYKNVQKNKEKLYEYIEFYIKEYKNINGTIINRNPQTDEEAKTSKESYYYSLRNKFNRLCKENKESKKINNHDENIECSALFIFLNKTCFRGLYREGPNGFNVPFGHYKKIPTIITKEELYSISDLIQNVIFVQSCFSKIMKDVKKGDFIYLDPPYAPENEKSFVKYVNDGFKFEMHKKLFDEIETLKNNNIKFLMSNSKVKLITETFKEYNSEDIKAKRAINSKNPESVTTEVLVFN
jgi:DNA adenine methylase